MTTLISYVSSSFISSINDLAKKLKIENHECKKMAESNL